MKILFGKVISSVMNKTIIVLIKKKYNIPIYNKLIYKFIKYHVHDDFNFCNKNDFVYIFCCKPLSKKKYWKIFKII